MRKFLIAALLGLSVAGCTVDVQEDVTNSGYVCKDGVEYFVYKKYTGNGVSYSIVPHFRQDGKLFTCPLVKPQQPVETE